MGPAVLLGVERGIIECLRNLSKKVRLFVSIACHSKEERENFLKCLESFSGI